MDQRLSMLMLAVDNIGHCRQFYEGGLGWRPWGGRQSQMSVKYMVSSVLITMIERSYLAKESGLLPGSGSAGIVLVINVSEPNTVDKIATQVIAAGGMITSPARIRDGGLYSFYFLDPDRNPWEVVWNPNMSMDENGVLESPI